MVCLSRDRRLHLNKMEKGEHSLDASVKHCTMMVTIGRMDYANERTICAQKYLQKCIVNKAYIHMNKYNKPASPKHRRCTYGTSKYNLSVLIYSDLRHSTNLLFSHLNCKFWTIIIKMVFSKLASNLANNSWNESYYNVVESVGSGSNDDQVQLNSATISKCVACGLCFVFDQQLKSTEFN